MNFSAEIKEIGKIADNLSGIIGAFQDAEDTISSLENEVAKLETQVEILDQRVADQDEEIDRLKMELLRAQAKIDEAEYQSLNKMYDSPDRENRTVAIEVINNLSND